MQRLLILVCAAGLAAGGRAWAAPPAKTADARWTEVLAEHTTGRVSRRGSVFIRFRKDVFPPASVGRAVEGLIEAVPPLRGTVVASGPREAVFTPKGWEPGRTYVIRVNAAGLAGLPAGARSYEFSVGVLERDLSLAVDELAPDAVDASKWSLKGRVETADVEDDVRVEKTLTATLDEGPLRLQWTHDGAAKRHAFLIAGLERRPQARALRLAVDGAAIGSKRRESREIAIPADGSFMVADARAISDEQQYAVVVFSDKLDPAQDLRGLVKLSSGAFTVRAEGNLVKVFPSQRLQGGATVVVEGALRDVRGRRLDRRFERLLSFAAQKPQVRFTGSGVILPDNDVLSIPFEAMNVHAVQVTAFRVYADDVGPFLQVNALPGDQELGRVGRFLWRKTIPLETNNPDSWRRFALDAGELLRGNRGALIRLTVSINRGDSDFACPAAAGDVPVKGDAALEDHEDLNAVQASGWDGVEEYYEGDGEETPGRAHWRDRGDPCADAYYDYAPGAKDSRNFLASNIGLIASRDQRGDLRVAASNLRTAEPLAKVAIAALNFQGQVVARGETDARGLLLVHPKGKPFYLTASKDGDRGYLKVSDGLALPVSHFDVGGERVEAGLKGFLYAERGVWRPGDEAHLMLIVEDREGRLPAGHPAVLRLYDPRGRLAQTVTNREPLDGFYRFSVRTPEDAPTGLWTAKARVGGAEFSKELRVEAVMPNRLKIELDFGRKALRAKDPALQGRLFAQWLHGAKASGLKADVEMKVAAAPTRFSRDADHIFDDPARQIGGEPQTVFEGTLDDEGRASFPLTVDSGANAPGMLSAQFRMRVFEDGGAFSAMNTTMPLHVYDRYVGVRLPDGDRARNMLLTDTTHQISLVALDSEGRPVSVPNVSVTIQKIGWKWWWDKSGDALAQFANGAHADTVLETKAAIVNGRGSASFSIKYPEWGRYLLRACDVDGGHCSGEIFYVDWPGWAGKPREQSGPGASALAFDADRTEYQVGQTARIRLPAAANARALIAIENGTGVLSQRWVTLSSAPVAIPLLITKAMAPNVYVAAYVLQPHKDKASDRPIRVYGVIPLAVKDPTTELSPALETAAEWRPMTRPAVTVGEARGRAMTYTLAVVDEGLLGLTDFKTPDPHAAFYKKEALGVTTWDLYDHVVGAYGGDLERLLALGGSEALGELRAKETPRRFPPVVRFFGPFELKAGEKQVREVPLSEYVGALRVMVIAGHKSAYGRAEKSVPVRQPLMVQPTLPRVVGPGEEFTVPVSVFTMGNAVRRAAVTIAAEGPLVVAGPRTVEVAFDKPGEKLAFFKLRAGRTLGRGTVRVSAEGAGENASAQTHLLVRASNPPTVKQVGAWIEPGESWTTTLRPHGMPGTNEVVLETSSLPPLNLEKRLGELIRYPYGCLEQTTSTLFPQFFLPGLIKLTDAEKAEVEKNVRAGLDRLRLFQTSSGGFLYWPGASGDVQPFATSYVGHFLVEAERRGYALPPEMLSGWERYQKEKALAWTPNGAESQVEQAYRLYTLAVAGKPELGAMNLLREEPSLKGLARWILAGAYLAAGVPEASDELARTADVDVINAVGDPYHTFASPLRDKALILQMMTLRRELARAKPLADDVSSSLTSERWDHTQALAQSLMGLARYYGEMDGPRAFAYAVTVAGAPADAVDSPEPFHRRPLKDFPAAGAAVTVRNTGRQRIFAALVDRGVAAVGEEAPASNGLRLDVAFTNAAGAPADPSSLTQGAPIQARVSVTNLSARRAENLALNFLVPAGWEIDNARWDGPDAAGAKLDYQDVRDDRVTSFLGLNAGETVVVPLKFTAAYLGRFYLPAASVEAMYDASLNANTGGRWVTVDAGR